MNHWVLIDSRTVAGSHMLLTQARADASLTDPVQDAERP